MYVLLFCLLIFIAYAAVIYNLMVRRLNEVRNARAQIEVQLLRRYDLIPNLLAVAKRYMAHEEMVFERISALRTEALERFSLTHELKALCSKALYENVRGFYRLVNEAYPELKADRQMLDLQEEILSCENRIAFARQYFNDVATDYNSFITQFPQLIFARFFVFRKETLLDFGDVPSLSLSS